jgi:DNA-binding transcriptional regulator YhcF (GntR family)
MDRKIGLSRHIEMVRIWISRKSTIPVREQLSAQLRFGILSGRLVPAERLPSIRDLARRLKIHANTVSAVYLDLAAGGWVTAKAGSGVFVHDIKSARVDDGIEGFVRTWIEEGLHRGFTVEALHDEFAKATREFRPKAEPRNLLVVHTDLHFARILAAEIEEAAGCAVRYSLPREACSPEFQDSLVLTTASAAALISDLPQDRRLLIPLKTIEQMLTGVKQPPSPFLIGIVSRSESILKWVSLLIAALGGSGNDVIARNPALPKWREGLAACDRVVTDVLAAAEVPKQIRPIVLRLVPDSFLEEARKLVTVEKA